MRLGQGGPGRKPLPISPAQLRWPSSSGRLRGRGVARHVGAACAGCALASWSGCAHHTAHPNTQESRSMAQDDYFSFGDEELDTELDFIDLREGSPDQAVALVEPPAVDEGGADEYWFGSSAERAARPRGDSKNGSSERRLPSSRWTRTVAALALGLLALFLIRTGISTLGGGEPATQSASANRSTSTSTRVARPATPAPADLNARRQAESARASRQSAAEGQRVRQHRAQTRRRARRRRQRIAGERQRHAKVRRAQTASQEEASAAPADGPATDYAPPTHEPAPPPSSPVPEPAPEPSSQPHIQNGANSPEFGL
jgi:hypothetical protein